MRRFFNKTPSPPQLDRALVPASSSNQSESTGSQMWMSGLNPPSFESLWSEVPLQKVETPSPETGSWYTSVQLKVMSKNEITSGGKLLEILGIIVDKYEGPYLLKPIILCLYVLGGVSLNKTEKSCGMFTYKASLDNLLSFTVINKHILNEGCDFNWNQSVGNSSSRVQILFSVKMERSRRPGVDIIEHYILHKDRHLPSFESLKDAFMIDRVTLNGSKASFY